MYMVQYIYIPGKRLDEAWDTSDSHQKLFIADELTSHMNQFRELEDDYCIGAIGRDESWIIGQIASIKGGPFDCEKQFNEFVWEDMGKYRQYCTGITSTMNLFLVILISVSGISLSKEAVSRRSFTGNTLAFARTQGITRKIGNVSRLKRFGNYLLKEADA